MNRKRNVSYIKPEDPEFLKVLKRQAGYDDRNHKFDDLQNAEDDFVEDEDSEKPQVVVVRKGDLTAEEVEIEKKIMDNRELEKKADLTQRIIFKSKQKSSAKPESNSRIKKDKSKERQARVSSHKRTHQLLSFGHEDEDE